MLGHAVLIGTIIVLITISDSGGYWSLLPAFAFGYPDSVSEAKLVESSLKTLSPGASSVFRRSDASIAPMFASIIPVSESDIEIVANQHNGVILLLKYLVNRPRPERHNVYVRRHKHVSTTAHTPAFPSGHSTQSYIVAQHYSRLYPHLEGRLYSLAHAIGLSRVQTGHHYPSDHKAGEYLARLLGT